MGTIYYLFENFVFREEGFFVIKIEWIVALIKYLCLSDKPVSYVPQTTDAQRGNSLHCTAEKLTPTQEFLGTAEACFVCHIGPFFRISLIYAFNGCP